MGTLDQYEPAYFEKKYFELYCICEDFHVFVDTK